jgi:hypothetical protein
MTRLLLLAYGRSAEYQRAIFATLSCWAWQPEAADLAITIFTDQPSAFAPYLAGLPVTYQHLTPELLTELQGPQQYVHRVKAAIIAQAFQLYPTEELLFIDSDTFFIAAPGPLLRLLASGTPIMHQREYTLAEAVDIYAGFGQAQYPQKLLTLLASRTFQMGAAQVRFHPNQSSWNSGVLGLPRALAPLLPDALALLDDLYAGTGWFTCEQLAFSLVLQADPTQPLRSSEEYVAHYWGKRQKALMDNLLSQLLMPAFSSLPLAERLRQVRRLVPRWHRKVQLDRDREGALYAFGQGKLTAGVKCTAKALLSNPLDGRFARELVQVLFRRAQAH